MPTEPPSIPKWLQPLERLLKWKPDSQTSIGQFLLFSIGGLILIALTQAMWWVIRTYAVVYGYDPWQLVCGGLAILIFLQWAKIHELLEKLKG